MLSTLMKCFAVVAAGVALIAWLQTHAPDRSGGIGRDRVDEFSAKCEQTISDSMPGEERRALREICDATKARLELR